MELAVQMCITIMLGFYLGYWLDHQAQGHGVVYTLIFGLVGIALGFGLVMRRALIQQEAIKQHKLSGDEKEKQETLTRQTFNNLNNEDDDDDDAWNN